MKHLILSALTALITTAAQAHLPQPPSELPVVLQELRAKCENENTTHREASRVAVRIVQALSQAQQQTNVVAEIVAYSRETTAVAHIVTLMGPWGHAGWENDFALLCQRYPQ